MSLKKQPPKFTGLLSTKEIQVAEHYSTGKTYKHIARKFNVSPSTIRNQIASIYVKLGIKNKAQLVCRMTRDIDDGLFESTFDPEMTISQTDRNDNPCYYACSDYPGFQYCTGKVQAETESELWQLIKVHAIVAHREVPAEWTFEERSQIKALIKPVEQL